ncbi:conserved hypothetical protein [Trichophyton verrucosum HKI 0517]|uniref:Uncharacterized protein n=1 Tax=Trichophyton verrucosum (strain HKI 0517) TaxID=663202 RepID=D4DJ75_TRIVH|nr:uncharacterized protein TRV_07241 [Trichophyton verrucosum HKI 0517]EFE38091.1 conserved hypothetical protein [Trichophyton verrucosum HKI 0517]
MQFLEDRMSVISQLFERYPRALTTAAAVLVVVGAPTAFLLYQHSRLGCKVRHSTSRGSLADLPLQDVKSMPESVQDKDAASKTRAVYDVASLSTLGINISPLLADEEILTRYLRRNMTAFSRFPQAYALSLNCDQSSRKTFKASHIQSLNFEPGDVVCGAYTVVCREQDRVEFGMALNQIRGRLVTTLERNDGQITFKTQTVMWQPSDVKAPMPLENPVLKFAHEITSWWMLEAGILGEKSPLNVLISLLSFLTVSIVSSPSSSIKRRKQTQTIAIDAFPQCGISLVTKFAVFAVFAVFGIF